MNNNNLPLIKTPYQRLNETLVEGVGIRRGQLVMLNSLPYNCNIGLLSDLTFGISLYNKPVVKDPTKKPLIFRITRRIDFEEEVRRGPIRFKSMAELGGPTAEEYKDQTGFTYRTFSPSKLPVSLEQLFGEAQGLERDGYELQVLVIDEIDLLDLSEGASLRCNLTAIREFFEPRGTVVIIHVPLGQDAKTVKRLPVSEFFKSVVTQTGADKGNRRLEQVVDIQWILSLEPGDEAQLHIHTAKCRGSMKSNTTVTYPVNDKGLIVFDVPYAV